MNKLAKSLVTIGIIAVFIVIFAVIVGEQDTPGVLGLILFAALVGGIRAIWKSNKKDENDNGDILQK